ncbi:7-cyano-7-deazaguanine synthase [Candidatus Calditenuaceae archaeon HR02]|nr:7-cyano-7-deazaguanine synthase [Candidatus Calditenuaceae archaeon HR02]
MSERILVLLSGGIDSAVALWLVRREIPASKVYTLTIDYHRRSRGEDECAARLAAKAGVSSHLKISLPFLKDLEDQPGEAAVSYRDIGFPPVFIPVRNLVFYSCAAHVAFSINADKIVVGHNGEDAGRFPDVGTDFIKRFNELLRESLPGYKLTLEAPLLSHSKRDVARLALTLGVPLEDTWSCWGPGTIHCGRCEGCQSRRNVFRELGVEDPTTYERINIA